MAQLQDIGPVYRGEDVTLDFTMTPVEDITGWTISFRVKQNETDAVALLTISATITSGAAGTFRVSLSSTNTLSLAGGGYWHDVWRTDSGSAAALSLGRYQVSSTVRVP